MNENEKAAYIEELFSASEDSFTMNNLIYFSRVIPKPFLFYLKNNRESITHCENYTNSGFEEILLNLLVDENKNHFRNKIIVDNIIDLRNRSKYFKKEFFLFKTEGQTNRKK